MLTRIEKKDTEIISKLILKRLDIKLDKKRLNKLFPKKTEKLKKVLTLINKIEDSWEYKSADNLHTYGRKHDGEIIKLWSVPDKSAQILENMVILTNAKNILDIGTSAGYSALHLSNGARVTNGKVYTIELLNEKAKMAKNNFTNADAKNITLLKDNASNIINNWKYGLIDIVFLDADKENYGKYLAQLAPMMSIGGIIIADNINDYGHMMEDYIQKVSGTHLPKTRTDHRFNSYYLAALDNGMLFTKKVSN